jgi:hypothetical protein
VSSGTPFFGHYGLDQLINAKYAQTFELLIPARMEFSKATGYILDFFYRIHDYH